VTTPSEAPQPVAASTYPDDLRDLVDRYLATLRFSAIPETEGIEEAMRYSLLAGGKRIRPVLALATARSLGMDPASVLPAAAALELIHTYSLIHDDLPAMDDDELRRGRPTSHVVYGENVAILAGDGLFAEAVRLFCEHQEGDPLAVLTALAELLAAIGVDGMVGGQYIDVTTEQPAASSAPARSRSKHRDLARSLPRPGAAGSQADFLRRLHSLKTGRLIAASVGVVLALRGLSEPETIPYRRFAEELGVLFQIVDDILDVTGSDEELGKPHRSDERHGKLTYVSLFGLDEARKLAAESHRKAHEALAATSGDPRDLSQITGFIYTRQS
jgi:geranylgeranyl diphosphate synthase type II